MFRWEVPVLVNLDDLQKTLNSVKVLRGNEDFQMFMRHVSWLLDAERTALETTKPDVIQLVQGRAAAFRELIDMVNNVEATEKHLCELVNQGQSE
jgi:hypothetical protein